MDLIEILLGEYSGVQTCMCAEVTAIVAVCQRLLV
jgi:hypothetical protein